MLRLINFICVTVSALVCLGLYHVAEETRMAHAELHRVNREIADEQSRMTVLEAEWARVADPARIQKLAADGMGIGDTPTLELSSLAQLPRRGSSQGPGNAELHDANARTPAASDGGDVHPAAVQMRD